MGKDLDFLVRLSRREALHLGLVGAAGLAFSDLSVLKALAQSGVVNPSKAKAKSVIQIWMWGGPCHIDTFDPKPGAGSDYTGPLNAPIGTAVAGMQINELLPELAKQANHFSLIRSMTHGNFGHETAAYMVQTGHKGGDGIVHPAMGAVTSYFKGTNGGYHGLIPPYVVLTQLLGRFSESGFLGSRVAPFATGGDPNQARFVVEGVVAEGVSEERQRARRQLLHQLDALRNAAPQDPRMLELSKTEDQAYDLILGDAGKIFDLSTEKDDLRTRYGRSTFGQSCLMARRLVEKGVPFVAINCGGWDTHKDHFPIMRRKLPEFDKALASLIQDLADRGLLDSTLIVCCGEFGRTPKVQWESPWNGGRGHWGSVFSALVAGGGLKGGQIVGASDAKGEQVKDRPVFPCDLMRTVYTQLGIDPNATLPHPQGMQVPVLPSAWPEGKSAGILKELM